MSANKFIFSKNAAKIQPAETYIPWGVRTSAKFKIWAVAPCDII